MIDSQSQHAYHGRLMHVSRTGRPARSYSTCKSILLAGLFVYLLAPALFAADPEIFPLSQVKPGMKGEAYTIFTGDQIEKFDLVVIGVMPNFLAPKESIILVQLLGPKVEHTGVVAGMSGSPVYFEGKLAGALSLKLGIFAKEPLGGVTPIEDIIHPQPRMSSGNIPSQYQPQASAAGAQQLSLPQDAASRTGLPTGSALEPI